MNCVNNSIYPKVNENFIAHFFFKLNEAHAIVLVKYVGYYITKNFFTSVSVGLLICSTNREEYKTN